jgi:hypothetical protein
VRAQLQAPIRNRKLHSSSSDALRVLSYATHEPSQRSPVDRVSFVRKTPILTSETVVVK